MAFSIVFFTAYLLFAIITAWLCIFAETDGDGFVAKAAIWTRETLPAMIGEGVKKAFGARVHAYGEEVVDYVCNKPNPIMQFIYLNLIGGGYALFVFHAGPHIPNESLGEWHGYSAGCCVAVTLASYLLACRADPGTIDTKNFKEFDCYRFDELLYTSGRKYEPSGIPKLARSKFCSVTGNIISRFDHYCAWLAQDVGERNYRFFLLFLVVQSTMLIYGSYLLFAVIAHIISSNKLYSQTFINVKSGKRMSATHTIVMQYLFHRHSMLVTITILCVVMMVVVMGFLAYHLWLVSRGTTTSESFKWASVLKAHRRFVARHADALDRVEEAQERCEEEGASRAAKEKLVQIQEEFGRYLSLTQRDLAPPSYAYSNGFLSNLWEVIYPLSTRGTGERSPLYYREKGDQKSKQYVDMVKLRPRPEAPELEQEQEPGDVQAEEATSKKDK